MSEKIITQVSKGMRYVLTEVAEKAAKTTKFVKRRVKVTGSNFSQMLVMGWLGKPEATLEELCQTGAAVGLEISPQGLDQRFTKEASEMMKIELEEAIKQVIKGEEVEIEVLKRFKGVYVTDSSTVSLPSELKEIWLGCGEEKAAVKLETRLEMVSGELDGPHLVDGRTNDRKAVKEHREMPRGSLHLADLGYWKVAAMAKQSENDAYWLSQAHLTTAIYTSNGQRHTLVELMRQQIADRIDLPVELGVQERLPARLVAVRVPQAVADRRRRKLKKHARDKGKTVSKARLELAAWTIFVTNVPLELLSIDELLVFARIRWQIELLFKLWKSHGRIDESRSTKPFRILTEFYAKLIGMLIQHWLFLVHHWSFPDRSLFKASKTVQQHALSLLTSLSDPLRLHEAISTLSRCLAVGCRISKSRKHPRSFQLLLALDELSS